MEKIKNNKSFLRNQENNTEYRKINLFRYNTCFQTQICTKVSNIFYCRFSFAFTHIHTYMHSCI